MRILRATINGFGSLVDETIDFRDESFICIYGENEAGKSTIQQFLLFMLFGFSPKWRAFYRPKTSSRMGGRLLITDEINGECTIERFDEIRNGRAICYTPDGGVYEEEWLKEHLNGMTYSTYQSIFSFSALDLYGIETMNEADLGEVLLSIGLTGSKNIFSIEKQLDDRMRGLFKPTGTNPVINQQLNKLESTFQTFHSHKDDEAAYRDKKVHTQTLNEKMGALEEQFQSLQEIHKSLEKQKQMLPLLEDYKYCVRQFNDYPDSLSFPENGLERLRQLNEKVLPLKSELSVLQENFKEYEEKQQDLQQVLYDEDVYSQAEEILREKPVYEETKSEMKQKQETLEKETATFHAELDQQQIGLAPGDLEEMTFPFYLERTWNELKASSEQYQLEKEQLEDELFFLEEKKNRVNAEQKEMETYIPDEQEIMKRTEQVDAYHKQAYANTRSKKETNEKLKWENITKRKRKQSNIALTVSGAVSILLVGMTIMKNSPDGFLIAAFFVLTAGIGQWIWQKQSIKSLGVLFDGDEYTHAESQITAEEKEAADSFLNDARKNKQSLHMLLEQKKQLDIQMIQWEEKSRGLKQKEKRLEKQIHEQYDVYPFLKQMKITYWPELFHTMKHLLQSVQKQEQLKKEFAALHHKQDEFLKRVSAFWKPIGMEKEDDHADAQLESINNLLGSYHENIFHIKQFSEWMDKNKQEQHSVSQKIITYEKEIDALYRHANVKTAEGFYKTASDAEEKKNLLLKQQQLEYQITSTLTHSEFEAMLNDSLHPSDLDEQLHQNELEMEKLKKETEETRDELASYNAKLANMESSDDFSLITHRFQMEQEQLQKWGYDWAVLKTAKEMLVETKGIYRDKYLHKVIDHTSHYFSTLTGGGYTRIFAPSNDTLFQVEAADLIRYNVQELSKGTMDQLYISLRLAISEVLSQGFLLPFMMDDAFVHFDSLRTERMMRIFSELAAKQQIIIFTNDRDIFQSERITQKVNLKNAIRVYE